MLRRTRRTLLSLTILLVGALSADAQVLTQDANHRYIDVNGTAKMLIGMSSEYLPHIVRPSKDSVYCTYSNDTYKACIDTLNSYGLNKLQVWAMMENSVGLSDLNQHIGDTGCVGTPNLTRTNWVNDQPFFWRGDNIWNLDRQNPTFFSQLNSVLAYAATKNVIVEVTLFDAYQGDLCTSPWISVNNIATNDGARPQFTSRQYFTAFDNNGVNAADCGLSDLSANQPARKRQMTALQWMVQNLNANTNFYWNIANEPDESPNATFTTSSTALINWHNCVASKIVQFESSLPNKHLIAANFWTDSALNTFAASGNANIKVVNGHYNKIQCTQNNQVNCPVVHGAKTFLGAIPLLNGYWSTLPNVTFGFNETKSSPYPSVASARAEAWEFAMGEGAIYDQYNFDRQDPSLGRTTKVLSYLNFLQQFLSRFTLTSFGRAGGTGIPTFVTSGLPAYPTATQYAGLDGAGLGNTYWSAMQWTRNQYGLYLHHSSIPTPGGKEEFKSYAPCYKAAGYQNTFTFALGILAGWYKVEWFKPGEAAPGTTIVPVCVDNVNWSGSGSTPSLTSPKYPYDLAVRILRCPGGLGPCATAVSCATVPVGPLPPDDDRRETSCSIGSSLP